MGLFRRSKEFERAGCRSEAGGGQGGANASPSAPRPLVTSGAGPEPDRLLDRAEPLLAGGRAVFARRRLTRDGRVAAGGVGIGFADHPAGAPLAVVVEETAVAVRLAGDLAE